jgi:spore germination cell wall hydrolase CwlJ-like protein
VVINRAVSRRYPASICGVVFQGERRRHKCQFSFACDGLSDRAKNRRLWQRAMHVAGRKLVYFRAGPVTRQATHYHADYVDPYWNRDMVKLAKIGRHIFYSDEKSIGF